ncbi:hypothetical protein V866_000361 [Kwoniella sp. B9012]
MVSTRPSPTPARGRIPYPTAATYTPGDSNTSPAYLGASEPIQKTTSRDSERERRVQGLKNWWKGFRESEQSGGPSNAPRRGVFGEPLAESIEYASVQVSTNGPDGSLVIPVVVAKCGLYLKENATGVEGTFRISGSAKRMRELQTLFDTPPKTVSRDLHRASLTVRFLTQMPKPKKKRKEKAPATIPQPPPLVKADSDMMLPSESDDEAPAGGYYVIEGPGRPTSPASPPASTLPNISAANLLPSPPVKPNIAPPDLMEMSESDEDAPPGGYEIRTGNPASARATLLAKALARGDGATPIGAGVARRRTLPSRRPGEFVPRLKRTAKEAP